MDDQDKTDGEYETPLCYEGQTPKKCNFGKQFSRNVKFLSSQRESTLLRRPSPTSIDEPGNYPTSRIGTRNSLDESAIAIKESPAVLDLHDSIRSPILEIYPSVHKATTNLINDFSARVPNSLNADLEFEAKNLTREMNEIVEENEKMSHTYVCTLFTDPSKKYKDFEVVGLHRNINFGKKLQKIFRPYDYENNEEIVEDGYFDLTDNLHEENSGCHVCDYIRKKSNLKLRSFQEKSTRGRTVEVLTTNIESLSKNTKISDSKIQNKKKQGSYDGSFKKPEEINNLSFKRSVKEFFYYLLFMTIACVDLMRAMDRVFIKSEFESSGQTIDFVKIVTIEDVWAYLNGPFLKGIHWFEKESFRLVGISPTDKYILNENRMLGTPRIRQVRIGNHTCDIQELFADYIDECYAPYDEGIEDKKPFGAGTIPAWTYHGAESLANSPYSGYIATYGGGGYYIELQTCHSDNENILSQLQRNNWLDRGTRAIFVDFTIYNANLNIFFIVKLVFERPPSGGIVPSWFPKTAYLIRYVRPLDYAVLAVQLVYLVAVVTYTLSAIKQMRQIGIRTYFKSVWNLLDCIIFVLSYFVIVYFIMSHYRLEPALTTNLRNHGHYLDFDDLSYDSMLMDNAASILIFFIFIKVFKFLAFNQIMSQLGRTVMKCAGDVMNFSFMLLIVFAAYAHMGTIMFGHQLQQFSSFYDSIFTLLRANFGDFDYVALEQVDGVVGPLYIFGFIFMVIFIMLNMFLAILCDTYTEVISEETKTKSNFKVGNVLRSFSNNVINSKWFPKCFLTRGPSVKWKEALRNLGFTEKQVKTIMRRFNKSSRSYISKCGLHYVEQVESKRMRQDNSLNGSKQPGCSCPKELRDMRHYLNDLEMSLKALSVGLDNIIFKTEVTIDAWADVSQDLDHICDPICYPKLPMKSAQSLIQRDQLGDRTCVCGKN